MPLNKPQDKPTYHQHFLTKLTGKRVNRDNLRAAAISALKDYHASLTAEDTRLPAIMKLAGDFDEIVENGEVPEWVKTAFADDPAFLDFLRLAAFAATELNRNKSVSKQAKLKAAGEGYSAKACYDAIQAIKQSASQNPEILYQLNIKLGQEIGRIMARCQNHEALTQALNDLNIGTLSPEPEDEAFLAALYSTKNTEQKYQAILDARPSPAWEHYFIGAKTELEDKYFKAVEKAFFTQMQDHSKTIDDVINAIQRYSKWRLLTQGSALHLQLKQRLDELCQRYQYWDLMVSDDNKVGISTRPAYHCFGAQFSHDPSINPIDLLTRSFAEIVARSDSEQALKNYSFADCRSPLQPVHEKLTRSGMYNNFFNPKHLRLNVIHKYRQFCISKQTLNSTPRFEYFLDTLEMVLMHMYIEATFNRLKDTWADCRFDDYLDLIDSLRDEVREIQNDNIQNIIIRSLATKFEHLIRPLDIPSPERADSPILWSFVPPIRPTTPAPSEGESTDELVNELNQLGILEIIDIGDDDPPAEDRIRSHQPK